MSRREARRPKISLEATGAYRRPWSIRSTSRRPCLAVNLFSTSNVQDQNNQAGIFDLANEPEIAHSLSPEFFEARALEGFAGAGRIVELGYPFVKKFQNARAVLLVEFA